MNKKLFSIVALCLTATLSAYSVADYIREHGERGLIYVNELGTVIGDLSGKGLTSLEGLQEIGGIHKVSYLMLNGNKLEKLDVDSFTGLTNFKGIELCNNPLTDLGDSLRELPNLTQLYLQENELCNLGKILNSLKESTKLLVISLMDNPLQELGDDFSVLPNCELYLYGNRLSLGDRARLKKAYGWRYYDYAQRGGNL